jgi:hypothetical protein
MFLLGEHVILEREPRCLKTGTRLFLSSLLSHAFFGVGIWLAVRIVSVA